MRDQNEKTVKGTGQGGKSGGNSGERGKEWRPGWADFLGILRGKKAVRMFLGGAVVGLWWGCGGAKRGVDQVWPGPARLFLLVGRGFHGYDFFRDARFNV